MRHSLFGNQSGFSFIHVLFLISVMAVMLLGNSDFILNQLKGHLNQVAQIEADSLEAEIGYGLASIAECSQMLQNQKSEISGYDEVSVELRLRGSATNSDRIIDTDDGSKDWLYGNHLLVTDVQISDKEDATSNPNFDHKATLTVFTKKNTGFRGKRNYIYRLYFTDDGANIITSCRGIAQGFEEDYCDNLSGTWTGDSCSLSEQVCNDMNGIWDSSNGSCDLKEQYCEQSGGEWDPNNEFCDQCPAMGLGNYDHTADECDGL